MRIETSRLFHEDLIVLKIDGVLFTPNPKGFYTRGDGRVAVVVVPAEAFNRGWGCMMDGERWYPITTKNIYAVHDGDRNISIEKPDACYGARAF